MGTQRTSSRFSWLKLLFSLLAITFLVFAGIIGYRAFTHELSPVIGSVSFIVLVGLFVWCVVLLRRPNMRYKKPSFKLVFWPLVGIFLVCTFAGVQPLSAYKDSLFNSISTGIQNVQTHDTTTSNESPTTPPVTRQTYIPYGTYVATVMNYSSSITLNSDGTCAVDSPLTGKIVGTYTVSSEYLTTYDPITGEQSVAKYRYLDQFKCLYIYPSDTGDPVPFYRQ